MRNPFADDIFVSPPSGAGLEAGDAGEAFQVEALGVLGRAVPEGEGGVMGPSLVVTAPRAGFGKTHLIAKFTRGLAGRALVVPLVFDLESPPRWAGVLWEVVRTLHAERSHRAGLTMMDEVSRFLFACGNRRLIEAGVIPCPHPVEVLASLERNYLEMFDFGAVKQPVARWFGEQFEGLAPAMAERLAGEVGVDPGGVSHWLRVLLAYAQGVGEASGPRLEALRWAVSMNAGGSMGAAGGSFIIQESGSPEAVAKEKLATLGRLMGMYRPIVFVIDHLDVFYRDGAAGLRIAYFVSELRRLLPRSLSVVSVNQDLWQTSFQGQLPSALEDRLSGEMVALRGLTRDQAHQLLADRLAAAGVEAAERADFWVRVGLDEFFAGAGGRMMAPRAVLRHAAGCWAAGRRASGGAVSAPMVLVPDQGGPGAEGSVVRSSPVAAAGASVAASSVVGDETLDSISAALQAMVASDPVAAVALPAGRAAGSFQRLKEKLDRLRPTAGERRVAAGVPVRTGGGGGVGPAPAPSGALARAYADQLKRRTESPVAPALDLERLGQLFRFAGGHFPVVKAAELGVPGTSGTAMQWLSPDAEILIGLESSTRPIFWSALTAHAAARARMNGGLPVKVVAFSEQEGGMHPAQQGRPAGQYSIDIIVPGATDLCELGAAGDILVEVEAGRLQVDDQDLATLLAQELESFWGRVTRLAAGDEEKLKVES